MVDMVNRPESRESGRPIVSIPENVHGKKANATSSRAAKGAASNRSARADPYLPQSIQIKVPASQGRAQFRHRLNRSIRREHLRQPAF
jgi:hypothetical protein